MIRVRTVAKAIQIRLSGLEFRNSSVSLRERFDFIKQRLNNNNPLIRRESDQEHESYYGGRYTDMHDIRAVQIVGGKRMPEESTPWDSNEFGKDFLDLAIDGFAPVRKDLNKHTLRELTRERLAGAPDSLPLANGWDSLNIYLLERATEQKIPQRTLRDDELIGIYVSSQILPEVDLNISANNLVDLLSKGGFNRFDHSADPTPSQKLAVALSCLSSMEQDIMITIYGNEEPMIEKFENLMRLGKRNRIGFSRIMEYHEIVLRLFNKWNENRLKKLH